MPMYEYQCKNCNFKFEQIQKINDEPLKNCPECQQPELHKLVSVTSFQLKGNGWYETDFKNKPSSNKEKPSKESCCSCENKKKCPSAKKDE